MNASPVALVLVALAAGTAASVGTVTLMDTEGPAEASSGAPTAQAVEALRREVERLADDQYGLMRQLQTLELQVLAGFDAEGDGTQPLAASHLELADLREQLASLSSRVDADGESGEPVALDSVAAALETIRAQEDAERDARRAELREDRMAERLEELTEELGLDSYQVGKMESFMQDFAGRRDELIDTMRETGDFSTLRDSIGEMATAAHDELTTFLTPTQMDMIDEMGGVRALGGSSRGFGGGMMGRFLSGGGPGGRGGSNDN